MNPGNWTGNGKGGSRSGLRIAEQHFHILAVQYAVNRLEVLIERTAGEVLQLAASLDRHIANFSDISRDIERSE